MAMLTYKLDWELCRKVAKTVCYQAGIHWDGREDFVSDALVEMMDSARRDSGGLSTKEIWRAAERVRSRYWRTYKKARRISSLNEMIPNTTIELSETIADDKALDLDPWLDAKLRLEHLPPGIILVGKKLERGDPLTKNQRLYLSRLRKGETKTKPNERIANYNIYHRRHAKGLCVNCGKESGKFSRCPDCRGRFRVYQKKYRQNTGQAWKNTLRDYWRRHGRCPRCGATPEPGYKTCPTCRAKQRTYAQRYDAIQRAINRAGTGGGAKR